VLADRCYSSLLFLLCSSFSFFFFLLSVYSLFLFLLCVCLLPWCLETKLKTTVCFRLVGSSVFLSVFILLFCLLSPCFLFFSFFVSSLALFFWCSLFMPIFQCLWSPVLFVLPPAWPFLWLLLPENAKRSCILGVRDSSWETWSMIETVLVP